MRCVNELRCDAIHRGLGIHGLRLIVAGDLGSFVDRRHLVNVMLPNDSNAHHSSRFRQRAIPAAGDCANAIALRLFSPRNRTLHSARRWGSMDHIKSSIVRANTLLLPLNHFRVP